jgi:ribosomal protein L7/L12
MPKINVNIDLAALTDEELIRMQHEVNQMVAERLLRGHKDKIVVSYEEAMMIKDRRPIEAIKSIRTRYSLGLKEAKDIIDAKRTEMGLDWQGQPLHQQ